MILQTGESQWQRMQFKWTTRQNRRDNTAQLCAQHVKAQTDPSKVEDEGSAELLH